MPQLERLLGGTALAFVGLADVKNSDLSSTWDYGGGDIDIGSSKDTRAITVDSTSVLNVDGVDGGAIKLKALQTLRFAGTADAEGGRDARESAPATAAWC